MSRKTCDVGSFIQNLLDEKNKDGTPKHTPADVGGIVQRAVKSGYISRGELLAAMNKQDQLITPAEFKEYEDLTTEVAKHGGSVFEALSPDKLRRLVLLSTKARNSVSTLENGTVSQARLEAVLDDLGAATPQRTIDILDFLDQSIEKANENGDTAKVHKLESLKKTLMDMTDLTRKLKVDYNAIIKTNMHIDKLTTEYALVKQLLSIGDAKTAEIKRTFAIDILQISSEMDDINKNPDLNDQEKQDKLNPLILKRQELMKKYNDATSKEFKKNRALLTKKMKTLAVKIQKARDNTPNSFLNKILMSVTGIDPEFFVTNLRELKDRQHKIDDDILLVEKIFEESADDRTFTHAEAQAIYGEDYFTTKEVKNLFYEIEKDEKGEPLTDSVGKPIKKKKEKITLADMKKILPLWSSYKKNKSYAYSISTLESTRITNVLLAGDQKLPDEIDPDDALPIARTNAEAKTAKVGYPYDPRKMVDRVKGIRDLQTALQRLSYLSSLPNNRGYLSTGMLVGVLGRDAQSLFHKYDEAVMDDLELDNPIQEEGETTIEGRRAILKNTLNNLGYTDSEISMMPEFRDPNYVDNFERVVAFDLEWQPGTNNIIAMSIVEFHGGSSTPVHEEVVFSAKGNNKLFDKDDAEAALQRLHAYQNNGFKVVGHNTHGADSDFQKLVSVSQNTNLGMSVALRSLDTMLLAFRNSPLTSFSRHFGPSLDNLSKALGTGGKGGPVTGVSAFAEWEAANLTGDYTNLKSYILMDSVLAGRNLQEMVKNHRKDVEVNNNDGVPQKMHVWDITPIWWDTAAPEAGRNRNYRGMEVLFDIVSFRNMREVRGGGYQREVMYDVAKVRNVTVNMILALMKSTNKEDLDTLLSAISATEKDALENIESLLEISRANHDAYLPILRNVREANGNEFLIDAQRMQGGEVVYSRNISETVYIDSVLTAVWDTLATSGRNADRSLNKFARTIGFRERKDGEDFKVYGKALFDAAATKFNGQKLTMKDFGNGVFDYVPAVQLGRGFAQVVMGHIDDGLTLSQDINVPLTEIDQRRAVARNEEKEIGMTDPDNLVAKREYLPITKENVSFFAPLSMYEQERMYNDFALARRYHYILNHDLTDADLDAFESWRKVNPIVELKNTIAFLRLMKKKLKEGDLGSEDDYLETLDKYFPETHGTALLMEYQYLFDKGVSKEEKKSKLISTLNQAEQDLKDYLKSQDKGRLEQGRLQRYNVHAVPNNRSIYARIPTMEEMEEMALENALDLPQFIAILVHDSVQFPRDQKVFLAGKAYWEQEELSAGGPTGAAMLAGIHPQIGWLMSHPEMDRDPELFKELTRASLTMGLNSASEWSESNYFDDTTSGLHHKLAMLWAYFPDSHLKQRGGLLAVLDRIKNNISDDDVVYKADLKDYYKTTYEQSKIAFDLLEQHYRAAGDTEKIEQVTRIREALYATEDGREFFKGAVIPKLYEGGYDGILMGLRDKKENKVHHADPLKSLTDADLQMIANTLCVTGTQVQARVINSIMNPEGKSKASLIDKVLGFDSQQGKALLKLFMDGTDRMSNKLQDHVKNLINKHPDLKRNMMTGPAAMEAIRLRLRTIAEYTLPAHFEDSEHTTNAAREAWIQERIAYLEKKWESRIADAQKILKDNGGELEIGSHAEREFQVALAGDQSAYRTQMTLRGINNLQNSGIKLDSSERNILENSVLTGRHIASSDLMFTEHVVFNSVGLGTGSGRAQYTGNYNTNLHGSRLNKGMRHVVKEDGSIDWKETINNSAWSLVGNPLAGKDRKTARAELRKLVVKNYLLQVATDYPPDMIRYGKNEESRSNFFKAWQERTAIENKWNETDRLAQREKLKAMYAAEGRTLTDEDIDASIKSHSTPLNKRIGVRILAGRMVTGEGQNISTTDDAKGLAAFRPRLADNAFEDRMVHGLYSMYQGLKGINTGTGSVRNKLHKMEENKETPETVLDMENSRATQYDPESLGVYFPEIESTLVEDMFGNKPTFNNKVLRMRFILDTFAIRNGLQDLKDAGEYAYLYQIYKIKQCMNKFSLLVSRKELLPNEIRFLHRHLVQQIFKLTQAQRDATNSTRNVLDLSRVVGIDPTQFREEDGTNLRWIDALAVLGDLGIEELGTVKFGMSPTELLTTRTGTAPDVLKKEVTATLPNAIQGEDVALLWQGMWANDETKKVATKFAEKMVADGAIADFERDTTGKYILLSSVPKSVQKQIMEEVIRDERLIMVVAENLGLYVTMDLIAGENQMRFLKAQKHAETPGTYVIPRRGYGPPTVSRVVRGSEDVRFYLTPEAIKAILVGARNNGFFSRLEVAVQVNKHLGEGTTVDTLRKEKYAEYLDKHLDEIAEETDILRELEGDKFKGLKTDRLKDKRGTELNLYDAEAYFTTGDPVTGKTPFVNAVTLDIRIALTRADQYALLEEQANFLRKILTHEEYQKDLIRIGFVIFLRNNVNRNMSETEVRALLEEHFGVAMTNDEYNKFIGIANKVSDMIDRINHSPFKGKNPYLHRAIKHREHILADPTDLSVEMDTDSLMNEYGIPSKDREIAKRAVREAYSVRGDIQDKPEAYSTIPSKDLIDIATDSKAFETAFPEGLHINAQLTQLKLDGVIDEETEIFYRLLIGRILKHNPNLAKYLSIHTEDLGTEKAGEAVKDGDRFVINLNPHVLKNMGHVDQVRVFAHEIAHIARLAFIKDDSPQWRQLESLFKSRRGAQAIEVMLLAVHNNKKYEGFDQDLQYFIKNPEEFLAVWGGLMLQHNVFGNEDVMKMLQSRSRLSLTACNTYRNAFHRIKDDVNSISAGLSALDDKVFGDIMDLTENLFGFTAPVAREIHVGNKNQQLGYMGNYETSPLSLTPSPAAGPPSGLDRLRDLKNKERSTLPLTVPEQSELAVLERQYAIVGFGNLDVVQFAELRAEREAAQRLMPTRSIHRSGPGQAPRSTKDLSTEQRIEIVNSLILGVAARRGDAAINKGTVNGALRAATESVCGKRFTNNIIWAATYAGTMDMTQAGSTYKNDHPVVMALMHVIGESLSHSQGQFLHETGSRSIRENRAYTQQWVENVARNIGALRVSTTEEQFNSLMQYARDLSLGVTTTPPAGYTPEQIALATKVSAAVESNSSLMLNFIHGKGGNMYDKIPFQLDKSKIGQRINHPNEKKALELAKNRNDLLTASGDLVVHSVVNEGFINGVLFYASGLGPRLRQRNSATETKGEVDQEFVNEMKRVQNTHPDVFEVIFEIAVRDMAATQRHLSEVDIRSKLRRSMAEPSYLLNGSPEVLSYWNDAAFGFYRLVDASQNQNNFFQGLDRRGKRFKLSGMSITVADKFKQAIDKAITSKEQIHTAGTLFTWDTNKTLPVGVGGIHVGKSSVIVLEAQKRKLLPEIMAGLFLCQIGDNPAYLNKNSMITVNQFATNPVTRDLMSSRFDTILADIERSQGFRATSELAIEDNSGITGYSIYDILDILDDLSTNNDVNASFDKKELKKALEIIRHKLHIEQGLQVRLLNNDGNMMTDFFLKWGPDITRLAYGPNLNTASLIMEGALGGLISTSYGGNPVEFFTDVFTGFFRNIPAAWRDPNIYDPRSIAVNMLYSIEHVTRNSRDAAHATVDNTVDAPTRYKRFKALMSRMHNSMFRATGESLTNQAQRIVVEHLTNGNLVKIREMFRTESMTNMSELKRAMNKHGISGIKPHLVFELKQTGMFEEGVIEAYSYMLNNVRSKYTKEGTLDFNEATQWVNTHNFSGSFVGKHGFSKHQAHRAVATMYEATKMFRNLVLVENNPWDSHTAPGSLQFLYSFYRQFPNLFFSQRIMRTGGKMDALTFSTMMVSTLILDLIYNALLLVALGMLPLAALFPWHEEFIFKKKPMQAAQLMLSRNPIFGATGNIAGGALMYAINTYRDANQLKLMRNEYTGMKSSINRGYDETHMDFVPEQALETMTKDPITAIAFALMAGTNMNDQESYDMYNGILNTGLRVVPLFGELPVRIAASKLILGDRPGVNKYGQTVTSRGISATPTPTSPVIPTPKPSLKSNPTGPYRAPKGL